ERGAETVHAAERHRVRFVIELTALGEVRRRLLEVLRRKERGGALARRGRENWRVGENEAASVEEIADGVHDFVADAEDRLLPLGANPEMTAVEQIVDPVLLRRDRVIVRLADHLEAFHVDLEAGWRTFVGAGRADHDNRR